MPAAEAMAGKLRERGAMATVSRPGLTIDLANLPALSPDQCLESAPNKPAAEERNA
jgi:hypothetical protein